jgi:hypothetical protein
MLKNLSPTNQSHLRSALRNLTAVMLLLLAGAVTAGAYTLVFRNGRRLEIPSEFTLTRTTLTYEVSPGFSKTMQLILIDVAATERANNEAPGSFFRHKEESVVDNQSTPPASRTVTNSDLAAVRQRRIQSEQAYETRRKELGLPTVEETRSRQAADGAVLREQIREKNIAKARAETFWRERARALRTEIATVDAQISYVRGRLSEVNENSLNNLVLTDVYPIWPNQPSGWPYPNYPYPSYPYPGSPYGFPPARPIPGLGYPYPGYPTAPYNNDTDRQRADLTNRVDDLVTRRAGLAAQWRVLEDEARDARVPQIWLEP